MEGDLVLTDPRALRALAHPTRLQLLERLQLSGDATATECGEALGISPAAASYHLRALARWGLVEEAGGATGRRRPWRARSAGFSFEPADAPVGAGEAAASLLSRELVASGDRTTQRFLAEEAGLSREWRRASRLSNTMLVLTHEEARMLSDRLDELIAPYLRSARVDPPSDARRARLLVRLLPQGAETP